MQSSRRIPRVLQWLITVGLLWMVLMTLYRFYFFFHYRPANRPFSGSAFLLGLRFDARIVCAVLLFTALLSFIPWLNPVRNRKAGMGWTIAWEPASRDFIGRAALEAERAAGPAMKQVGLVLESRGVLREGMTVTVDGATGVITSGTFSPTLKLSIAIARVPAATGDVATVDLRGVATPVRVVKLPFVRNGKQVYA
mgnify:CR=1 FL=1